MKLKVATLILLAVINASVSLAGGGMWIPSAIDSLLLSKMTKLGFGLTAEDIYSDSTTSMKDAVVWFGKGCTGEIISNKGLLLTNYHCSYSQVQARSTINNDYLKNGFWAQADSAELPCPGLTVTFIKSIIDVSKVILNLLPDSISKNERDLIINTASDSLVGINTKNTHYGGFVKSYYYNNRFFLFITEEFTDVRLVGTPPSSIGKFGGETDNWVWPRHTGDFALFRVYASPENNPAPYSPENKPFSPRYHFPISLEGVNENDFTLVYGFPGTTSQYITSGAVKFEEEQRNPARIAIRKKKLEILDKQIMFNDTVRIKYAATQQRVANAYKKWQGEFLGLTADNTIDEKLLFEQEFKTWASKSDKSKYINIVDSINSTYQNYAPYRIAKDLYYECTNDQQTIQLVKKYLELDKLISSRSTDQKNIKKAIAVYSAMARAHFKGYHAATDRLLFIAVGEIMYNNTEPGLRPEYFTEIDKSSNIHQFIQEMYDNSVFTDEQELLNALSKLDYKRSKFLRNDPLLKFVMSITEFESNTITPNATILDGHINDVMQHYMAGLLEMKGEQNLFPDANSSLRISFGKVEGFDPQDGITYKYFTTLDGIIEKGNRNNADWITDPKLSQLQSIKDYGPYGYNDTLVVAFIASNHTTGGNSGSPVLNKNGELIGTNFDRVWEGTMSDIKFDPSRCRNITLDIRYTLFIIDKFAGCSRIIDELTLTKGQP